MTGEWPRWTSRVATVRVDVEAERGLLTFAAGTPRRQVGPPSKLGSLNVSEIVCCEKLSAVEVRESGLV